jgi:hypothetical protein
MGSGFPNVFLLKFQSFPLIKVVQGNPRYILNFSEIRCSCRPIHWDIEPN